ncbi:hypothetical protein P691DRAFT_775153 [Macrolepiota fuliginosa MF-IS2]|uniref:Protein F37C4.5 n=1 Tax=Macrolepiota fuliginosa MF-IS2 TaxID=1400762 RepID=A0A9P5XFD7_9AGAR|nr:hypothetical protein P691DRAFT_775153 [Macrolepiota fuliginosa MF-IS2]
MSTGTEAPPSFEPNSISLVSVEDSKISSISLYSSRAEITRIFRFSVKIGLNQVNINGLPNVLDQASLRVEGTGDATIHDVTISSIPPPEKPTTSPKLEELLRQKKATEQSIDRCSLAINSLQTYLGTLNVKDVAVSEVANIVKTYQKTGEELDNQINKLRDQLEKTDAQINTERKNLTGPTENQDLMMKVAVGVFASEEGEVEFRLIYAVHRASWQALYDVRVDVHSKEKPVELTYKASITQSTGEDWKDIDLTLETAEPTFGVDIPRLFPWTISAYRPTLGGFKKRSVAVPLVATRALASAALLGGPAGGSSDIEFRSEMRQQEAFVNSKGNITATFGVPGKINIPSDGATHNVTIIKLNLEATMHWVTVPKQEAKTHLSAKIKNASDYTFLAGQASIYVNGSFIARIGIPPVSPEESFECPLGLDSSVRVTYHPRTRKTSRSGFYSKITTQVYTQHITVNNTKTTAVNDLKVTDQFPVSDDSTVTVKQLNPGLPNVNKELMPGEIKIPEPLKVSPGVFAQWSGADEPDINVELLGRDGKFDWICSVPPQGKIDLLLQYEVISPSRAEITGL